MFDGEAERGVTVAKEILNYNSGSKKKKKKKRGRGGEDINQLISSLSFNC